MLQETLHLTDVCRFAVDQLLGQGRDHCIGSRELMQVSDSLDHSFGVSLYHHVGDPGIGIAPGRPGPGHFVCKRADRRVQFWNLQAPA